MAKWQLQDAKARFSEFLNAALRSGPQIVTRRGVEEAVLVPMDQWKRLERESRPDVKTVLLGPGPRIENLVPARRRLRRRPVVEFE
jgi:antitoxin Phd